MNKCIKITIKNCTNLNNYKKILKDLQYQTWLACNKAMTYYYSYTMENMEYKNNHGINIDEKERFGKSYNAWVENRMNEVMNYHNSGNVAQTRQFIAKRFNDDKKKGLFKGKVSISNFKQNIPIIIHNKNYKIYQGDKGYELDCSLFNIPYQKENKIKKLHFTIDTLNNSQKEILNKIISGSYKQGSSQLTYDNKGKWYLIISFGFEPQDKQLDKNRVLGVDLGIVNTATIQIYDYNTNTYDWLKWNQCVLSGEELIKFQQRQYARHKSMQKQIKTAGEGRCGHGKKTKMKPFEKSSGKISNFKDTFNHKYSKYIVEFAVRNNCGIIQMEDLSGFKGKGEKLLENWSYYDLQQKVKYKAEEHGIEVRFINPTYTSKRCNECGSIHIENRDCKKDQARFSCVACGYGSDGKVNADINAARNIALLNIEDLIEEECIKKGLKYKKKKDDDSKVA